MSTNVIDGMLQDPKLSDLECLTRGQAISFLEVQIPSEAQTSIRLTQLLNNCYVTALLERRKIGRPSIVTITMSVKTTRNTNPKEVLVNNIPTDITLVYHVQGAMHKPDSMAPAFPPIKESKAVCGPQVLYSRGPYPEHRRNSIQLGARSTSTVLAPDSRVAASHARTTNNIKGAASPKSHTPHAKSDQLGVAGETSVQGNQEADDQPRDVGYDKVKGQEEVNSQDTSTGCVPLERRMTPEQRPWILMMTRSRMGLRLAQLPLSNTSKDHLQSESLPLTSYTMMVLTTCQVQVPRLDQKVVALLRPWQWQGVAPQRRITREYHAYTHGPRVARWTRYPPDYRLEQSRSGTHRSQGTQKADKPLASSSLRLSEGDRKSHLKSLEKYIIVMMTSGSLGTLCS